MKNEINTRRAVTAMQIQEAMNAAGMTRRQFADAMHRRPSEVTRWLSGRHNFTIDLLSAISEVLGVQITGVLVSPPENDTHILCDGVGSVGPIFLPDDCIHHLERRAASKGEGLTLFVKNLLLREAVKPHPKAASFCGIWSESDFDMSVEEQIEDIKSHRSVHRMLEEI